jgi:hypothetical protein
MLRNRLGVSSSDSFFRDDVLDDAINAAIATLESERNWPWQLRTATLTTDIQRGIVALPADWRATRALYFDTNEVAQVAPYELLSRGDHDGEVDLYAHIGNQLHVRDVPTVGTELTLMYYRAPTLLESDSDVPDIPSDAYPAIVAKAAQLSSTREDDRPSAQAHLLEYTQWVERLQNVGESSKRPVGRRIRPGNWT